MAALPRLAARIARARVQDRRVHSVPRARALATALRAQSSPFVLEERHLRMHLLDYGVARGHHNEDPHALADAEAVGSVAAPADLDAALRHGSCSLLAWVGGGGGTAT